MLQLRDSWFCSGISEKQLSILLEAGWGHLGWFCGDFRAFSSTWALSVLTICVRCSVAQSCLTLSDPRDCSPPGFSVADISQARIVEWVVISFSRGSSQPRDWNCVSCNSKWIFFFFFFYHWATCEATINIIFQKQNFLVLLIWPILKKLTVKVYLLRIGFCQIRGNKLVSN